MAPWVMAGCGAGANVGQWSVSAMDKGKNSTHFKWQKMGNQPAPQNPNPNGGQVQNPTPNNPAPNNGGQQSGS